MVRGQEGSPLQFDEQTYVVEYTKPQNMGHDWKWNRRIFSTDEHDNFFSNP